MKVSKYFDIQEMVPKYAIDYLGEERSIWLIDNRLYPLLDLFREHFNVPVTVNNWHIGGTLEECGWRGSSSKTGATLSQHKFGRAADLHFEGLADYDGIRDEIKSHNGLFLAAGLTTIEASTPTWLHIDIRYTGKSELLIVPYL